MISCAIGVYLLTYLLNMEQYDNIIGTLHWSFDWCVVTFDPLKAGG